MSQHKTAVGISLKVNPKPAHPKSQTRAQEIAERRYLGLDRVTAGLGHDYRFGHTPASEARRGRRISQGIRKRGGKNVNISMDATAAFE